MRWGKFLYVAGILILFPFSVNAATVNNGSLFLTLDTGFVGRPVNLELFERTIAVSWNEGTLVVPSNLLVDWDGSVLNLEFTNGFAVQGKLNILINGKAGAITAAPVMQIRAEDLTESPTVATNTTTATATPVETTDETILLSLDSGFIGRPATFVVFNGELSLAWDEKTLVAATTLRITRTRGGLIGDQVEAAKGVAVEFGNLNAVSDSGKFTVQFKASRPQGIGELSEVNVLASPSVTVSAAFAGEHISFTNPASPSITFAPAFRKGIMRLGLASWYAYKNCLCAASPDVPKGTRMKVSRADDPTRYTVVTINDWGPERDKHPDRVIDLDKVAFERIGNPRGGVLAVVVDVLEKTDPLYKLGDELPPPPWRW